MKTKLHRVHWKTIHGKLRGDKFAVRAIPSMLVEGYFVSRGVSIGDPNGGWKQVFLEVEYDREYVVEWLVNKVIQPFSKCDFQTIQKLVGDAYRLYKEQKKQIGGTNNELEEILR